MVVEGLRTLQCKGLRQSGMFCPLIHQLSASHPHPHAPQLLTGSYCLLYRNLLRPVDREMSKISCLPKTEREDWETWCPQHSAVSSLVSLFTPAVMEWVDSFICSPVCTNLKSLIQLSVTAERTVVIFLSIATLFPPTNDWCFSLVLVIWFLVGLGLGHQLAVA